MKAKAINLYHYGFYLDPRDDDPVALSLVEAEKKASRLSVENSGTPVAVWMNKRLLKLFAGNVDFTPITLRGASSPGSGT